MKYRRKEDRIHCVLSYSLLGHALMTESGIKEMPHWDREQNGKPFLISGEERKLPFFSLSHSGRYCACAIGTCEIGTDVQTIVMPDAAVVRACMSEKEQRTFAAAVSKDEYFTRAWTRKESRLKLSGEGILGELKDIETGMHDEELTAWDGVLYQTVRLQEAYLSICVSGTEKIPIPVHEVYGEDLLKTRRR